MDKIGYSYANGMSRLQITSDWRSSTFEPFRTWTLSNFFEPYNKKLELHNYASMSDDIIFQHAVKHSGMPVSFDR